MSHSKSKPTFYQLNLFDETIPDSGFKRCSKKNECIHPENINNGWLPATSKYFPIRKDRKNGLYPKCKACKYQQSKKWHEKNTEYTQEYFAKYYKENLEKRRSNSIAWGKRNKNRRTIATMNHRARKRNAIGSYTLEDVKHKFNYQKGKCFYCKCDMALHSHTPKSATVDHVVPLNRGGSNFPTNIVIACWSCNASKRNRLLSEWKPKNFG